MADVAELLRNYVAQQELQSQGSIMGKPPQARHTGSPLLDTVLNALDAVIGVVNPLENISGPSQAILGPIGRTASTVMNQAQKKAAKALWRGDPATLEAVKADPRLLNIFTPGAGQISAASDARKFDPVLKDAYAYYRGSQSLPTGSITVGPELMQGAKGAALANLPQVMTHEATHFLNQPRIYEQGLADPILQRMTEMLSPYLSKAAQRGVAQGTQRVGKDVGLDEALAYLSGPGTRNPATEDIGKRIFEALRSQPGQPSLPLTPGGLSETITKARAATPAEPSVLDYIKSIFGG